MIKFLKMHPEAKIPERQTEGAAGFDLHTTSAGVVSMGFITRFQTGIAVAIPEGFVGLVKPRSGWAVKHGVDTMAGVIDSDYRGEINVILTCEDAKESFTVERGDRIAQLVVVPFMGDACEVDSLDDSERGIKGFGSTGK